MTELGEIALGIARSIQDSVHSPRMPPDEGLPAESQQVIPFSVVRNTRGYIEAIANQINGCYEHGWYDGCSVMVRRLVETLIIEVYEHHGMMQRITDSQGNIVQLNELISRFLSEASWAPSRTAKKGLPQFKSAGDLSAHSRRYVAHRHDVDKTIQDLRVVVQELIYLAGLG